MKAKFIKWEKENLINFPYAKKVGDKILENVVGGVSAPMATLNNTPGIGSPQPPASVSMGALNTASIGSGDLWGNIGNIHTQDSLKKKKSKSKKKKHSFKKKRAISKNTNEENINPYDKIGVLMAKKMNVPLTFKKVKGGKEVKQINFDKNLNSSNSIMTFDERKKKFAKR